MSQPTSQPAPISAAEQDDIAHARAALRELIDRANSLAQLAHQQAFDQAAAMAANPAPPHKYIDFIAAFDRAATCVRRCILVRQKLHEPRTILHAPERAKHVEPVERVEKVETVERGESVERGDRIDRIDRIDTDEFNDMDRPMGQIIAEICNDLGIAPPPGLTLQHATTGWARRTPNELVAAAASQDRAAATQAALALATAILPATGTPPPYPLRP